MQYRRPEQNAEVSYREEVHGHNCGLGHAHGSYVSTEDDAASCRTKCSANKGCLGYTTYDSPNCGLKCLHYSHTCDEKHQASTECTGNVVSYSKVPTSVNSFHAVKQPLHASKNTTGSKSTASSTSVTSGGASKAKNQISAGSVNAKSQTSAKPSQNKSLSSAAPSKVKSTLSNHKTSTKAEETRQAHTKTEEALKTVINFHNKVTSPAKVQAKPTAQSVEKKTATSKVSKSTGATVSKKTEPVKAVAKKAEPVHAANWKDFLPKKEKAKEVVASSSKGSAVSATVTSDSDCPCVHRHGKKVCPHHCHPKKDEGSVSAVKNHGS